MKRTLLGLSLTLCLALSQAQAESSSTPYLDQLKKKIDSESHPASSASSSESYSKRLQESLGKESEASYIEQVRDSETFKKSEPKDQSVGVDQPQSYTDSEKLKLAPETQRSAIQDTLEGKAELQERRKGEVRHAFGLKYGASLKRDFKVLDASSNSPSFSSLYEQNYGPQFGFFFEYQPYHSEWWGSLGLVGAVDFGYFNGTGQLSQVILQPGGATPFPLVSNTQFQFFLSPVTLGVNYRLNLLRYIRPFIFVGPTAVGYLETRNDDRGNHYGVSTSWLGSAGVSILLNPWARKSAWDLYLTQGVHHYYLTVEYSRLMPLGGMVRFAYSGVFAGLTYEY